MRGVRCGAGPHTLHAAPYILHTLHAAPYTPHPACCTLHPSHPACCTPCTLLPHTLHVVLHANFEFCTLHPAPCTLHPAPCTLHPSALHPKLRVESLEFGTLAEVVGACQVAVEGHGVELREDVHLGDTFRVQGSGFRVQELGIRV